MSDQMPDEVWLERPRWDGWGEYTTKRVENPRVHRVRYIRADLYEQAEAERDALRQQAEGWAQEARTQRATVHECYQACTGATGEPGDWHGAEPVRAVVAERDRLRADIKRALPHIHEAVQHVRVERWWSARKAHTALRDLEEALDHD